jgi:hypothetical protein
LFHLEVTERIIRAMVEAFGDELTEARIDSREVIRKASEYGSCFRLPSALNDVRKPEGGVGWISRGKEPDCSNCSA